MIVRSMALHTGDRFEIQMGEVRFPVQVVQLAILESDKGQATVADVLLLREDTGDSIVLNSLSH